MISLSSKCVWFLTLVTFVSPHCLVEDGLETKFAPITSGAVGLPLNAAGYAIESFGGGAYMVTEGNYQGTFDAKMLMNPSHLLKYFSSRSR